MRVLVQKSMPMFLLAWLYAWAPLPAFAGPTPASASAEVFFANLKDGETVRSPVAIQFAATGIAVEPAGAVKANSGHFHLLIDTALSPEDMNRPIPNDKRHLHFSKAQTEATIDLPPGEHTLQIVMGDGAHVPHRPAVVSKVITVTVK